MLDFNVNIDSKRLAEIENLNDRLGDENQSPYRNDCRKKTIQTKLNDLKNKWQIFHPINLILAAQPAHIAQGYA